jgi:DNA-binding XRE family transcriptional regulator
MMTYAYQETYVHKFQIKLGNLFDIGINDYKIDKYDLLKIFLNSYLCNAFENGDISYLCSKSGLELFLDMMYKNNNQELDIILNNHYIKSKEYWIGYALAYYQWISNRTFKEMFEVVTFDKLENMYYTLHEADIRKFVDIMDELMIEYFNDTNLKRLRKKKGYSQKELSLKSNVSLRSIQMYEQKNKNINKANAETIYSLSLCLDCKMEDLLEK